MAVNPFAGDWHTRYQRAVDRDRTRRSENLAAYNDFVTRNVELGIEVSAKDLASFTEEISEGRNYLRRGLPPRRIMEATARRTSQFARQQREQEALASVQRVRDERDTVFSVVSPILIDQEDPKKVESFIMDTFGEEQGRTIWEKYAPDLARYRMDAIQDETVKLLQLPIVNNIQDPSEVDVIFSGSPQPIRDALKTQIRARLAEEAAEEARANAETNRSLRANAAEYALTDPVLLELARSGDEVGVAARMKSIFGAFQVDLPTDLQGNLMSSLRSTADNANTRAGNDFIATVDADPEVRAALAQNNVELARMNAMSVAAQNGVVLTPALSRRLDDHLNATRLTLVDQQTIDRRAAAISSIATETPTEIERIRNSFIAETAARIGEDGPAYQHALVLNGNYVVPRAMANEALGLIEEYAETMGPNEAADRVATELGLLSETAYTRRRQAEAAAAAAPDLPRNTATYDDYMANAMENITGTVEDAVTNFASVASDAAPESVQEVRDAYLTDLESMLTYAQEIEQSFADRNMPYNSQIDSVTTAIRQAIGTIQSLAPSGPPINPFPDQSPGSAQAATGGVILPAPGQPSQQTLPGRRGTPTAPTMPSLTRRNAPTLQTLRADQRIDVRGAVMNFLSFDPNTMLRAERDRLYTDTILRIAEDAGVTVEQAEAIFREVAAEFQ